MNSFLPHNEDRRRRIRVEYEFLKNYLLPFVYPYFLILILFILISEDRGRVRVESFLENLATALYRTVFLICINLLLNSEDRGGRVRCRRRRHCFRCRMGRR